MREAFGVFGKLTSYRPHATASALLSQLSSASLDLSASRTGLKVAGKDSPASGVPSNLTRK